MTSQVDSLAKHIRATASVAPVNVFTAWWYIRVISRDGSRISGKGLHMYKGVCGGFTLLILSHFA